MDNQSISHIRRNCTYHIVFIHKYRKKILYIKFQQGLIAILRNYAI